MKVLTEKPACSVEFSALEKNILHLRITPPRREGYVNGLEKYGFYETLPGDPEAVEKEDEDFWTLSTSLCTLKVSRRDGTITFCDGKGNLLLRQEKLEFSPREVSAVFEADEKEDFAGFGDVSREHCWYRGKKVNCFLANVKSYIASPFFFSTKGYALLVNTTFQTVFDMACTRKDRISFADGSGVFDIFLFAAPDCKSLVSLYTRLTGRPKLPPVWSLGLWHICNNLCNARDTVEEGLHYREKEIPCDVIGLEPGWMGQDYDYGTKKNWDPVKFPHMIQQFKFRNRTFLDALKNGMGFHFELWLCEDYDLTWEEERRIHSETKKVSAGMLDNEEFDTHLLNPSILDPTTIPEEPWFEHLKNFVDFGADFFKLDAAKQVIPHPDRHYANGMDDEECHNLYCLMLIRQMYEGFASYTKRRPLVFNPCGWTTFQKYAVTWTGDTGGRQGTLTGMMNTAMLGHGIVTNDMAANEECGIHFGYLLPLSQINNYSSYKMPWLWGKKILELHRFYSSLRSRLIPYLYSSLRETTLSGLPVLMPLCLEFENDPACRNVKNAYLFGNSLLVVIYEKETYFPEGKWQDFWTGKIHQGKKTETISWPEDRAGGLFLREGGIVPMGPVLQYRSERKVDELEWRLFPGEKETGFTLYEDDGVSFDYEEGKYALTVLKMERNDDLIRIHLENTYAGIPSEVKKSSFRIVCEKRPVRILSCGQEIPFAYDEARGEVSGDFAGYGETLLYLR